MTPLRELYDLYYYPNPAKEERRHELLMKIPIDARDEDNYGRTSLHIAAEFADCEAIASLLDRGAEVNDRDEEGHTPLFRLASRCSRVSALEEPIASAARLLLDRGANLPRSARGTTALIEAVQNRHHAMAAVLIDSGRLLQQGTITELTENYLSVSGQPDAVRAATAGLTVLREEEMAGSLVRHLRLNSPADRERLTADPSIQTAPMSLQRLFVFLTEAKEAERHG